ncbi:MAG TPA: hypothetical protein VFE62_09915 [Gemmataceae bacterium]|nr:hypothetical protein [Gemmataceae bacterium]
MFLLLLVDWHEDPFFGKSAFSRQLASQPYVAHPDTGHYHQFSIAAPTHVFTADVGFVTPMFLLTSDAEMSEPVHAVDPSTLHLLMSFLR